MKYEQRDLEVEGAGGGRFVVVLRRNLLNRLDFSILLRFVDEDGTEYNLVRYNGRHSSKHTNEWEKRHRRPNASFTNAFHIHRATERYQREFGHKRIEKYAETTERYGSFEAAVNCFLEDNGFERPSEAEGQLNLFPGEEHS